MIDKIVSTLLYNKQEIKYEYGSKLFWDVLV
jgi:hypothetical protein